MVFSKCRNVIFMPKFSFFLQGSRGKIGAMFTLRARDFQILEQCRLAIKVWNHSCLRIESSFLSENLSYLCFFKINAIMYFILFKFRIHCAWIGDCLRSSVPLINCLTVSLDNIRGFPWVWPPPFSKAPQNRGGGQTHVLCTTSYVRSQSPSKKMLAFSLRWYRYILIPLILTRIGLISCLKRLKKALRG